MKDVKQYRHLQKGLKTKQTVINERHRTTSDIEVEQKK